MSDVQYINTQEIRKDLIGFIKSLESGREVVVLNRSKVVSRLNQRPVSSANPPDDTIAARLQKFEELNKRLSYVSAGRKFSREEMNEH